LANELSLGFLNSIKNQQKYSIFQKIGRKGMKSVIPLLLILKRIESQSPEEIAAALAKKALEDRVFLERKVFDKTL